MTCRSCGAYGAWRWVMDATKPIITQDLEPTCARCQEMLNDAIATATLNNLAKKLELLQIEGEIQAQGGRSH